MKGHTGDRLQENGRSLSTCERKHLSPPALTCELRHLCVFHFKEQLVVNLGDQPGGGNSFLTLPWGAWLILQDSGKVVWHYVPQKRLPCGRVGRTHPGHCCLGLFYSHQNSFRELREGAGREGEGPIEVTLVSCPAPG